MQIELQALKDLFKPQHNFLVVSHKSPDGDAVGSVVAFYRFLTNLSFKASIVLPDRPSDVLMHFLDPCPVIFYDEDEVETMNCFEEATVLICLDFNTTSRVGSMQKLIEDFEGFTVMIDHHPNPDSYADIILSDVTNTSTCQLIFECIESMGLVHFIDKQTATAIYLGMVTDTGSFRYPSVTSKTHRVISRLFDQGMEHWQIHQQVFDNNRLDQLKLRGYAIAEKLTLLNTHQIPFGYIALTAEELNRFNYRAGDTEGLVNIIISIEGIKAGVLILEKSDGIKMSFRSKDGVFVNEFVKQYFNGGGHNYAAGGYSKDSMEVTISRLISLIPSIFNK